MVTADVERRTVSIREFAAMVGISSGKAYQLARADQLPVPVLKFGEGRMVIPRAAVEEMLDRRKESDAA